MRTLAGTARAVAFPYVSRRVVVSRPSSDASRLGKRSLVRSLAAAKGDDAALAAFAKLGLKDLDEAARRFQYGLEQGLDEDYLVATELGAADVTELSDLQRQYKEKIKEKLLKRIVELKKEDEEVKQRLSKNFSLGKEAYSCGEYMASVKLLEVAVEELGPNTQLGGEAQLWLALAYQACAREQDCIELYKSIETNHPMPKIRKQAYDLRYIMEAPKLVISEDERVKIPLIQSDTWRQKERKTGYSQRIQPAKPVKKTYWDSVSWDMPAANFIPDKWYIRVAWACLVVGVTLYVNWSLGQNS